MIEVFRTNVQDHTQATRLMDIIHQHSPGNRINFDLDDCDRILRIEGENFTAGSIIMLMQENGFDCSVLP